MQWSIAGVMNFNMFGIPMVGPDTCGFYESSKLPDEADQRELCARWIQLATFYPFARQHHDKTGTGGKGGPPLEPYVLGGTTENPTEYVDMAKAAIRERFSYMRFMYTCLFKVSKDGGSCFDPLMYHYPHDDTHFMPNNTEHTFLVGDAVKVTPVLKPNATELWSYFPNGKWVSLRNTSIVEDVNNSTGGDWRSLDMNASKDGVHSHLRPGYMIPM
jgi:alpha-glucosidase (family GH31 glycosyl hydrolase)